MAEKPLTGRQRQAMDTKRRIRERAFGLIEEEGYDSLTISKICQAAGVSNGNFYHYYCSKEELLLSGYSNFDDFVRDEFSLRCFDSPLMAIHALIYEQVVGANQAGPKLEGQLLRGLLALGGGYFVEKNRYFHLYLRGLVEQAVDKGEIHPSHNAEEVSQRILRLSRGILFDWAMRQGHYRPEEQARVDLDLLFVALRLPLDGGKK